MTDQRKPTIVLDAGHGGKDPGAVGNGLLEKNVTLDLALRVGKLLEARGASVKYTRTTDIFLELSQRARLANEWGGDYFVSFHVNSAANTTASGFESFTYSEVNGGATAAFQNTIHRKVAAVFGAVGVPDRRQKKGNLAVLRETKMPAILLEYGFINSPKDSCLLKDSAFLDKLAQATADGIAECFGLPPALRKEEIKQSETQYPLNPEDANKIISFLGAGWNICRDQLSRDEFKRLANEIRKASGQPLQ